MLAGLTVVCETKSLSFCKRVSKKPTRRIFYQLWRLIDFAVLQASGSNESCCENFPVKSQIKNVLVHKLVLLWYKTIVLWFKQCVYRVVDALWSLPSTQEARVGPAKNWTLYLSSSYVSQPIKLWNELPTSFEFRTKYWSAEIWYESSV